MYALIIYSLVVIAKCVFGQLLKRVCNCIVFLLVCKRVLYPCGNCDAPICCPGASTWQTTKCLVISCISSLLKKVLKHSLSVGQ